MKKFILMAATGMIMASCSHDDGNVTINLPADFSEKTVVVTHLTMDNIFAATEVDDLVVIYDTLEVNNGVAKMKLDPSGPAQYTITPPMMTFKQPEFYASPNDNLEITIKSFEPLDYSAKGTPLMEDLTTFFSITDPILQQHAMLIHREEEVSPEELKASLDRYDAAIKKFVADNPQSPVVPFVIIDLSGDDFKAIYDNMTPEAKN